MGSMIQVGSSVRTHGSPAATDSSPMNLPHTHTHVHTVIKIKTDRNCLFFQHLSLKEEELEGEEGLGGEGLLTCVWGISPSLIG